MGYLCYIKQFDFIISLCEAGHVLSNTVALSTKLQGKTVDLIEAAQEARVVINIMREAIRRFGRKCMRGGNLFDIEPCMLRTTGRQQHKVNVPDTNPESYWQRAQCVSPSY